MYPASALLAKEEKNNVMSGPPNAPILSHGREGKTAGAMRSRGYESESVALPEQEGRLDHSKEDVYSSQDSHR